MIAIVDYRAGNLASVRKAFAVLGADAHVVTGATEMTSASAIVVPGVGHFGATEALDGPWRQAIRDHVAAGRPLLGICLGMQWLFESSAEASGRPGLGLMAGQCRRLRGGDSGGGGQRLKVPHVGWNNLELVRPSALLEGTPPDAFVYFTHSYAAPVGDDCVATATHGERFAAAVERGSMWGVQFHPEKSGDVGLRVLRNFVERART